MKLTLILAFAICSLVSAQTAQQDLTTLSNNSAALTKLADAQAAVIASLSQAVATPAPPDPTVAMNQAAGLYAAMLLCTNMPGCVPVASTNLSANWITTEYNNQSSPSTFISFGSEI